MSGGNRLLLSLTLSQAGQEQPEGSNTGVPATNPESYWKRAVYIPLIDRLIQEMKDRLLSQEDHFRGQYLLPTKLQGLSNDVQDKMYATYKNDLTKKREYDNKMLRWKTMWLH